MSEIIIDKTKTIPDGVMKLIRHNLRIKNKLEMGEIQENGKSKEKT